MGVEFRAEEEGPLFETKSGGRGRRAAYKVFAATIFLSTCGIWSYRLADVLSASFPDLGGGVGEVAIRNSEGRSGYGYCSRTWGSAGMFLAELAFGLYWVLGQSIRWNITYRIPFKGRLSLRYEDKLPRVDIFVCTADPEMEPPSLVINTVLSLMSYNYPAKNLSVYLSDDGWSEFTFYALLEASGFAKHWIPFCKKFNIEPRSPAAYFAQLNLSNDQHAPHTSEAIAIERLYREMKHRIDEAVKIGSISKEVKGRHKGFSEWHPQVTKWDHQSIVQVVIDGRDENAVDNEGCRLPTLVYMAREKRPEHRHNFKAGAMNALIRVSSEITNAPIILNLDCDMYANNSDAIREALCFFMDEERGHQTAFVQFPQNFENITPNDLYYNSCTMINQVEMKGLDGAGDGTALYCGTGCFHRRDSLCGRSYSEDYKPKLGDERTEMQRNERTVGEIEEASKVLANCSYEEGTQWGKGMGLMYGCAVEDIVTGISIQCRGWKSVSYNPRRRGFLGVAPNTLELGLEQFKRWSEGMFQIFLSKYCPFTHGHGKITVTAQMAYSYYLLWAPLSVPTLFYVTVPPLFLLHGIPLFPEVSLSSPWFLLFVYVALARNLYSVIESLECGVTLRAWWNSQRMLMFRRTSSFLFALADTVLAQLGLSQTGFVVTSKVVTPEVQARYENEVVEFGSSSVMFTLIATLAVLNLFTLIGGVVRVGLRHELLGSLTGQFLIAGYVVLLNLPVYEALLVRHDAGCLPVSVTFKSVVFASVACLVPLCLL